MAIVKLDAAPARRDLLTGAWRTLVSPPATGPANMAMDHALMDRARRTGESVLRVYTWSAPTVSLGRHQAVRGRIRRDVADALGVALVRRPTGGRALLHHREVTYSVTAPLRPGDSVREWYGSINDVLLAALRGLGVAAATAAVQGRTPSPGTAACFVRADAGEIAFEGRKLVGSALLRQDGVLLQHGSILLEDDQELLTRVLPESEAPPSAAGTLRQALGRVPEVDDVARALFRALSRSGASSVSALGDEPHLAAGVADAERWYASDEWTWRA